VRNAPIRLGILVEGETERLFVIYFLAPYLLNFGVIAKTVPVVHGQGNRGGGGISVKTLVAAFKRESGNFDLLTCMVDYYGLQGKGKMSVDELLLHLRERIKRKLGPKAKKVILYVQVHEIEALLFSQPSAFGNVEEASPRVVRKIDRIAKKYRTPEEIDGGYSTCPSRQIKRAFPEYDKIRHVIEISRMIGMEKMCGECPRFGQWVGELKALGQKSKR